MTPPLSRVHKPPPAPTSYPSMTTSAADHKSLTTNSINFSGLEYLWMPVAPQSVVFCLELNTRQKLLRPVTALMVERAYEYRRGGLAQLGS